MLDWISDIKVVNRVTCLLKKCEKLGPRFSVCKLIVQRNRRESTTCRKDPSLRKKINLRNYQHKISLIIKLSQTYKGVLILMEKEFL